MEMYKATYEVVLPQMTNLNLLNSRSNYQFSYI